MLLAGMPEGAPNAIDARAARLSFHPPSLAPVCCAHGAPIDVRQKLALLRLSKAPEFRWDERGPVIDERAPSGVFEYLADVPYCAALLAAEGGLRGEACGLRAAARAHELREDVFLLDGCALFPLDQVGSVLTPSARLPESMLSDVADDAHAPSLWDEARARFSLRYGEPAAVIVDAAASDLRGRRSRGLHLKTLR